MYFYLLNADGGIHIHSNNENSNYLFLSTLSLIIVMHLFQLLMNTVLLASPWWYLAVFSVPLF